MHDTIPMRTHVPASRPRRHRAVAIVVTVAIVVIAASAATAVAMSPGPSRSAIADGVIPDGRQASVFDDIPAIANLDADLLSALRDAAADAETSGVTFGVNSGWRSAAYQERLWREALEEHGSREDAARWVAPPDKSLHVSGAAVDLGSAASDWLLRHGAGYGLCRIYDNEPWHYELRLEAVDHGCPAGYADPSLDPRLRQ